MLHPFAVSLWGSTQKHLIQVCGLVGARLRAFLLKPAGEEVGEVVLLLGYWAQVAQRTGTRFLE
jgi:hypothetical protein